MLAGTHAYYEQDNTALTASPLADPVNGDFTLKNVDGIMEYELPNIGFATPQHRVWRGGSGPILAPYDDAGYGMQGA